MNNSRYNIYLNSPQLALRANNKQYYKNVIKNNENNTNKNIKIYSSSYFNTSYNLYNYPNIVQKPSI